MEGYPGKNLFGKYSRKGILWGDQGFFKIRKIGLFGIGEKIYGVLGGGNGGFSHLLRGPPKNFFPKVFGRKSFLHKGGPSLGGPKHQTPFFKNPFSGGKPSKGVSESGAYIMKGPSSLSKRTQDSSRGDPGF